jgi:pimeloyl-ACP methyl ester carboxylesterase
MRLTSFHRGGSGTPLVCLHGFLDTWRTWELVLPSLERHHDVLAPTLPGHAGGPPPPTEIADAVERAMDDAGLETAHIVGNSLGGYLALQLAARGRASSVPSAGARSRDLLPHADWVELDRVGHCPQLDVPLETVELVLGHTPPMRSFRPGRLSH